MELEAVFHGGLKSHQIKSAEAAVGVLIGLPVTFRAGNHATFLRLRIP